MNNQSGKLTILLFVLLAICLLGRPAEAQYGGGTGEPNDPYLIYTAEQMNAIGTDVNADVNDWDKHFKLMEDIDLSAYTGTSFNIIGYFLDWEDKKPFSGVFDGNGKRISNFRYSTDSPDRDNFGLFGYVEGNDAQIRDLRLVAPYVQSVQSASQISPEPPRYGDYVGSLVGVVGSGGTIINCSVEGGKILGFYNVGGLVGYGGTIINCTSSASVEGHGSVGGLAGSANTLTNCVSSGNVLGYGGGDVGGLVGSGGTITNCYAVGGSVVGYSCIGGLVGTNVNHSAITNCCALADVRGRNRIGGLVGDNDNGGPITACYATGSVSGESRIGGLVGSSTFRTITITNCYSSGDVSGDFYVGGLVGINGTNTISNCYSSGEVSGDQRVGGLLGYHASSEKVTNCFWDTQTSGQATSEGGTGKTTAEMQMQSTFTDAGWDFIGDTENGTEDIWCICEGVDYPKLTWQFVIGDFDSDDKTDFLDFCIFASRWLQTDSSFFCYGCGADLTNDGNVDFSDLKEFANNWLTETIWSFYLNVEDFESYNDIDPNDPMSNRIFNAWLDGYDNPATNGSVVGYEDTPFTEQTIVHGGSQSMPYFYNTSFKFSKAELPLSPPQDWTREGIGILSLWFHGNASNAAAPMSVVLNGTSAVYYDNPNAAQIDAWTEWTIDLEAFTGVDLTDINSIAICFGEENKPQVGGSGMVYFDDIRLYRAKCK